MTHAYSHTYLADAEDCLATAFDYAVHDCQIPGDTFVYAFIHSGLSRQFEQGNPAVIAGMSGLDLACEALGYCGLIDQEPQPTYARSLSPEYWAGWALAQYQWGHACRFADIFSRASFAHVVDLYHPLHEADISVFCQRLEQMLAAHGAAPTNLARMRKLCGLSQSQLAQASGVGLKSIQAYEQRTNSLNKASGQTLLRLATTLGCSMESLMEFEPQLVVEYLPETGALSALSTEV